MLILYRNYKQSIRVGDDIEIKILKIDEDQVAIGIKAPRNICVLREELKYQKQKKSNLEKEHEDIYE